MFGRHHAIGAAVGLPGYHGHLGHGCLGKCKQQLRAVANDPSVLLADPRQETGNILKSDQWDIETITKPDESRRFHRSIDVQNPGQKSRLIGHYSDRTSGQSRKPHDNIFCIMLVYLEHVAIVYNSMDYVADVVRN